MTDKIRTPAHPDRSGATSPGTTTKPGRSAGGKSGDPSTTSGKIFAPIPAWGTHGPIGGVFGENRVTHTHMGLDVDVPIGSRCVAPSDGTIGKYAVTSGFAPGEGPRAGGGMIHFIFDNSVGSVKPGTVIGWGHVFECYVKPGQKVKAGQLLGKSGGTNGGQHVHFIQRNDENGEDGAVDPAPLFKALQKGETSPTSGGSTGSGGGSAAGSGGNATAAAFATFLELPGILDTARSQLLSGEKSLMNDEPLLPFVEQLCQASLRNFQSMPNGNFYAFFPDYFGGLSNRTAYWEIDDVEIIDGQIELSDDSLATHVYIVGDTSPSFGTIDLTDELMTSGVVTLFEAFSSNFISGVHPIEKETAQSGKASGPGLEGALGAVQAIENTLTGTVESISDKDNALTFLKKYGARPHREDAPMVRSPFYELFLAYQKFMLLWSQQFLTTFSFTFMPELFPGGIVAFPDHGIQCYVAEVSHDFDYESGFTTQANLMAPAALPTSDRKNVHNGLIRSFSLGDELPFDPFAKPDKKTDGK